VHCHGENALGTFLADDILVEEVLDFARGRHMYGRTAPLAGTVFGNDFIAQLDAFVADVDIRTSDQFGNFIVTFPAKGTGWYVSARTRWRRHLYLSSPVWRLDATRKKQIQNKIFIIIYHFGVVLSTIYQYPIPL
jgi:hypothetical protein